MGAGFSVSRAGYLQQALSPERLTCVLDIGANPLTPPSYTPLLEAGLCQVWGFEPHPEAFEALIAAAVPNTNYLPDAVGAGGAAELRICRYSGFSSTLEPNTATFDALQQFHRPARVMHRVPIETRKLDDIGELPQFDLLKIDIQGGELAVFEGGKKSLNQAVCVITEVAAVPLYVDQPLFDAQMISLRACGYVMHKFLSASSYAYRGQFANRLNPRRYRNQFVDGDVVFIRHLLSLRELPNETLKHLVILADAVFDSQDLAVAVMTELYQRGVMADDAIHAYIDQLPFVDPRAAP